MRTRLSVLFILFFILSGFQISKTTTDPYVLDVGHTHIGFDVERFLVGEVSGRFNDFSSVISMNGYDLTSLKLQAVIKVNSLDSNNDIRDGHLKGQLWLDAETYPDILFSSTSVHKTEKGGYRMSGKFTIKGITNTVEFPIEILGPFKDPTQKTTIGIKADFIIDRFDYGIKFNKKMDNGSFFIGNEVKIKIRALAYKE